MPPQGFSDVPAGVCFASTCEGAHNEPRYPAAMKITKIQKEHGAKGRVNVYANGDFLIGIHPETLLRFRLRIGDDVTAEALQLMREADGLLAARNSAMRLLAVRPRSERELFERLREKEFDEAQISKVLEELKHSGLVNDVDFACMFVRNALAVRPAGRILLKRRLLALGIPPTLADQAIGETFVPGSEEEYAIKAAEGYLKKHGAGKKAGDERRLMSRLTAFLLRSGYPWAIVEPIVRHKMKHPGMGREEEAGNGRESP
jgi:regulatory protein